MKDAMVWPRLTLVLGTRWANKCTKRYIENLLNIKSFCWYVAFTIYVRDFATFVFMCLFSVPYNEHYEVKKQPYIFHYFINDSFETKYN